MSTASVPLSYVPLQVRDTDALEVEHTKITKQMFKRFEKYDLVVRAHPENGTWDFEPGQYVKIVPGPDLRRHKLLDDGSLDERDYWVARIQQMGLRVDPNKDVGENLWVEIFWCWRVTDSWEREDLTQEKLDNINHFRGYMGKEEVILSNVLDYVSILTIEGPANVSFLDEVRITNNIVDGDFYYRVRFEYKPKTKSRKASRLFRMLPKIDAMCKADCDRHYAPDYHIQRWCDPCARWFHQDCLTNREAVSSIEELVAKLPEHLRPPADVPVDVRDLAYSPICRGLGYGPSGTGCYQLQAKKAIYSWLDGTEPKGWDDCVLSRRMQIRLAEIRSGEIAYYQCPTCDSHI